MSYDAFANAKSKADGKKALGEYLRMAWKDEGPKAPGPVYNPRGNPPVTGGDSYVKAHFFDVDLAAVAICNMKGPKPSKEYLAPIREALRETENWRWMTQSRNLKEVKWVNEILDASEGTGTIKVDGHFKSKILKQKDWTDRHQDDLGDGFIAEVQKILSHVEIEGEGNCTVQ
jgi:hypothetical protein